MLRLQRSAGNRAVAQLSARGRPVQRDGTAPPVGASAPPAQKQYRLTATGVDTGPLPEPQAKAMLADRIDRRQRLIDLYRGENDAINSGWGGLGGIGMTDRTNWVECDNAVKDAKGALDEGDLVHAGQRLADADQAYATAIANFEKAKGDKDANGAKAIEFFQAVLVVDATVASVAAPFALPGAIAAIPGAVTATGELTTFTSLWTGAILNMEGNLAQEAGKQVAAGKLDVDGLLKAGADGVADAILSVILGKAIAGYFNAEMAKATQDAIVKQLGEGAIKFLNEQATDRLATLIRSRTETIVQAFLKSVAAGGGDGFDFANAVILTIAADLQALWDEGHKSTLDVVKDTVKGWFGF